MALHCAATLFIARHGDAAYAHGHVMSDDGGWLTDVGRQQVTDCAAALRPQRVAMVYASPLERARESGQVAAPVLDVPTRVLEGLAEIGVGELAGRPWDDPQMHQIHEQWMAGDLEVRIPGGESGSEVLHRFEEALLEIADLHRGEQVLVFSHGGIMAFAIPRLSGNVRNDLADKQFLPNAVPATVEIGDDGWQVLSWPGSADKHVV